MIIKKLYIVAAALFLFPGATNFIFGQEAEKKVHIKIVENGKTTIDTSFAAKNMQGEALKNKIKEITGENIDLNFDEKKNVNVWVEEEKDSGGEGQNEYIVKKRMKMHEGDAGSHSYRYVVIDKDDEEGDDLEDEVIIIGDDTLHVKGDKIHSMHAGKDKNIYWVEEKGEGENDKNVIVKVIAGDEADKSDHQDENDHVIVVKSKNGTIIEKNIKVVKVENENEGEGDNIKITVEIEKEHGEKTNQEKKLKETKQKSKDKRKRK